MVAPGFELRHTVALANADSRYSRTAAVRRDQNERQVTGRKRQEPFSFYCALRQSFDLQPACERQQSRTQNPRALPVHTTLQSVLVIRVRVRSDFSIMCSRTRSQRLGLTTE